MVFSPSARECGGLGKGVPSVSTATLPEGMQTNSIKLAVAVRLFLKSSCSSQAC